MQSARRFDTGFPSYYDAFAIMIQANTREEERLWKRESRFRNCTEASIQLGLASSEQNPKTAEVTFKNIIAYFCEKHNGL